MRKKWNSRAKAKNLQNVLKLLKQFNQTVLTIFETEHFFNLLTEIPQIQYTRTIMIEVRKTNWDLKIYRKI